MPAKKTTTTKSKAKAAPAPAITVETVEASAGKSGSAKTKAKNAKPKSASKAAKAKTTVAETVTPAAETNVVVTDAASADWEPSLSDDFAVALNTLAGLRSQISCLQTKLRALQKRADKEIRIATKTKQKRKGGGQRAPSGFVKPTEITEELAIFLGKDKGTEMARTEVTREINAYIRAHNLQDPSNGRRILPDAELRKLLRVPQDEELTYFNLQRYMSHHFVKKAATSTA